MGRRVVMTGVLGTMAEDRVELMRKTFAEKMPEVDFEFLFDGVQDDDTIIQAAKGAEIVITQFQFMSEKIYQGLAPELKAVCANGVGYNAVNLEAATRHGVLVCNIPNANMEEVAVHTVALILAEQRRMKAMLKWIDEDKWEGAAEAMAPVSRFSACTVGLCGFGKIARLVAKMLSGFGCRILAYDPYLPVEVIRSNGAEPVDFDTLLSRSDYLSIHLHLLPSTRGMFNRDVFRKMKKSAFLINCSRGGVCDPGDLYDALVSGEIAGAALDVFDTEPPEGIEAEIKKMPNVLATPHIAYYSEGAYQDAIMQACDNCVGILKGVNPGTIINGELWRE